jgi:hypothetical protein
MAEVFCQRGLVLRDTGNPIGSFCPELTFTVADLSDRLRSILEMHLVQPSSAIFTLTRTRKKPTAGFFNRIGRELSLEIIFCEWQLSEFGHQKPAILFTAQ